MNYKAILFIVILFAIVLTGLSCKPECRLSNECDDASPCTRDSCINKKCVHIPIADCRIGDGNCDRDEGENECKAPQDCGSCTGQSTEHLSYQCNQNQECVAEITGDVKGEVFSENTASANGIGMAVTFEYNNPFNVDKDLFNVKIELTALPDAVSDIKIKRIEVMEKLQASITILNAKDINKPLFKGMSVQEEVPLKISGNNEEKGFKPTVKITYEYVEQVKKPAFYEKTLTNTLILVDPTTPRSCPVCDDNNDCTQDICSAETDYFCDYIPRQNCCGNFVCDANENECTCTVDCGSCERDYGVYMRYRCSNLQCLPMLKDSGVVKPKTLLNDISFADFQAEVKTTMDIPFNIYSSRIKVDMEARVINVGVQNIRCKKLQLTEGNELLGEADANIGFVQAGQVSSGILTANDFMRSAEENRNPTLKISCEYDKGSQHILTTRSISLGKMTFIGPK